MSRAVLSIGSNLGDRLGHLQSVVDAVRADIVAVSPVYVTAPWGGVEQDDFLNAVLLVDNPDMAAMDWLRRAHALEEASGRVREIHWGPRTLDVDIIACDDIVSDDPVLTLPHPQAHHRAFVLLPWYDIAPDAEVPGHGRIADLIAALPTDELSSAHRQDTMTLQL